VDQLFDKIKVAEEGPEKHKMMEDLEAEINHDLPWIMLYYTRSYELTQERVKNFRYSDIVFNNIKYLKISDKK
jgi:hypothetical protein